MYGGFRKLGTPSHQCYLIGCSINYKPSSYSATPHLWKPTYIYTSSILMLDQHVFGAYLNALYAMYPSNSMNMYDTYVCTCI